MIEPWTPSVELRDAIAAAHWRDTRPDFMPEHPHQYIVVHTDPDAFRLINESLREHGYDSTFYGHRFRYVNIDGWKYWSYRIVLNREKLPAGHLDTVEHRHG